MATSPSIRAVGAWTKSATNPITIPAPASNVIGNVLLLFLATPNALISGYVMNWPPTGWSPLTPSQGSGTSDTAGAVRIDVFYRIVASTTEAGATIDYGSYSPPSVFGGQILEIQGVNTASEYTMFEGITVGLATSATTATFPQLFVRTQDCLILNAVVIARDSTQATMSAWANSTTGAPTEVADNTANTGVGIGLAIASATFSGVGLTGQTTATLAAACNIVMMTFAIRPASGAPRNPSGYAPRLSFSSGPRGDGVSFGSGGFGHNWATGTGVSPGGTSYNIGTPAYTASRGATYICGGVGGGDDYSFGTGYHLGIERFDLATSVNSTIFGHIQTARYFGCINFTDPTGRYAYLAGGTYQGYGTYQSSTTRIDSATDVVAQVGNMLGGACDANAMASSTKVYVVGPYIASTTIRSFSFATQTWVSVSATLPVAVRTSAALPSPTHGYVFGGNVTGYNTQKFDFSNETLSSLTTLISGLNTLHYVSAGNMVEGRFGGYQLVYATEVHTSGFPTWEYGWQTSQGTSSAYFDSYASNTAPTLIVYDPVGNARTVSTPEGALTGTGYLPTNSRYGASQSGFRWRNDDGTEATATWKDIQNAAVPVPQNTIVRLRILVESWGDQPAQQFRLEYRKVGDVIWNEVK